MEAKFEWDENKNKQNILKHQISFENATGAFTDKLRVIAEDTAHSFKEKRYYCFGKAEGGILTVRFTYRRRMIRIIGAGYWRKGKEIYEKENKLRK